MYLLVFALLTLTVCSVVKFGAVGIGITAAVYLLMPYRYGK